MAGRPVPAGWYSEPWWQSALRTGATSCSSVLLFDAMFSGMRRRLQRLGVRERLRGPASSRGYDQGYDQGMDAGSDGGGFDGGGADGGGGFGGGFDGGGFGGGDFGGGDFGGGDFGGFDF